MKTTINYTSLEGAAKAKKAIADIKSYLGNKKYAEVAPEMALVTNPKQFAFYCMIAGIEGYPVVAWYESFHGEGSFEKMEEASNEEA